MNDYEMEEPIISSELVNRDLLINDLVDRLSELPLGLIHYIFSFLPMRDVVATSCLSKKWKNMWTIVPFLNFNLDNMDCNDDDQNFLNRVLRLWKGDRVLKFEIDNGPHFYLSAASDMDSWVSFAVENKVLELNIDLSYDIRETNVFDRQIFIENYKEIVYSAPQCLYSCSSIRKLRLVGCNLGMSVTPSWNQLTSLIIDGYCFSTSSINLIMTGSPRLEVFELRFLENFEDLNIVSTSLKKLKIEKYVYLGIDEPSARTALRICCPNLETLEILGALYSKCVFTDVSSLTDSTIGYYDSHFYGAWHGERNKWLENMLTCSSIRKLHLVGCNLGRSRSPSWYQFTSLIIDGYCFSTSSINLIMSGSPRLELFELRLLENHEDLNIVSTSLKKLKIEKYLVTDYDEPSTCTSLRICCPNLEKLEILGVLYSKCVFTDVSSLTDATIGFYDSHFYGAWYGEADKWLENMMMQILTTIQHVEKLALSYWCVEVLGKSKKKHLLSPLEKVKFLKLDVRCVGLGDMMALVGIFPNVKALDIKHFGFLNRPENYTEFEANLPNSFLHQLKIIEISLSIDSSSELWFFEVLLKRASLLGKLVIRVKNVDSHQQDYLCEVAEKLHSMPRSSPIAKVIFNPT